MNAPFRFVQQVHSNFGTKFRNCSVVGPRMYQEKEGVIFIASNTQISCLHLPYSYSTTIDWVTLTNVSGDGFKELL
jgi:hypothetical protein